MASRRYKKRADGRYCTTVWDGTYTNTGKKKRKVLYARTVRELDEKVRQVANLVEEGGVVQSDGEDMLSLAARWVRTQKGDCEETTRVFYKRLIEFYMQSLSEVKPENFTYIHVKRILDGLDGHTATQKKVLMTLKQIIAFAVREKRITQAAATDVLECFPKVKHHAKEKRPLTPAEKEAVFKVDLAPMDRCFLCLIYGCGLRREEALALTTEDFDMDGHVSITKARALLPDGTVVTKPPKSRRGYRTLPLPASIRETVEAYARTCNGDLFPGIDRDGMDRMWRRVRAAFRKVCPESDGLTPHIFRHNYCTELCYQIPKLSVKNVARLLGDSEAMVLEIYSHIDLEREPTEEAVDSAF